MQLTKNFALSEFSCNDKAKTPVPDDLIPNVQELANNLQVLRDFLKTSLHINSGYRTPEYNKKVGGASQSQHLLGKAADIRSDKYTPAQIYQAISGLIAQGKMKEGGLGRYNTFTHYDIRGTKSRWDLRK